VTCWRVLAPLVQEPPSAQCSLLTGHNISPAGTGVDSGSKGSCAPPTGCSLIDCSRRGLCALGTATGCSCIDCSRRNLFRGGLVLETCVPLNSRIESNKEDEEKPRGAWNHWICAQVGVSLSSRLESNTEKEENLGALGAIGFALKSGYHSTLGLRVIKKKKKNLGALGAIGMSGPSSPLPAEVRSMGPARLG